MKVWRPLAFLAQSIKTARFARSKQKLDALLSCFFILLVYVKPFPYPAYTLSPWNGRSWSEPCERSSYFQPVKRALFRFPTPVTSYRFFSHPDQPCLVRSGWSLQLWRIILVRTKSEAGIFFEKKLILFEFLLDFFWLGCILINQKSE